ncbi:MAG TPA: methyltransferase domain-containing protein [Bryobacteraceae bacterium]|nr:methyltransferase domain-containing protein [Bryobacteraceae bacterium]
MQTLKDVNERMQQEWNARAVEDANFYVAFGRRQQDPEEFFATASEVVQGLEGELRRITARYPRARRALEIGCGPGRLLRPMSRHFGEIHGVDVSDEMIARAQANLRDIPHAHAHHTTGSDLAPFADNSFEFVYSYAVFQHIPSLDVVLNYWREAHRVMRPGAILRAQINGLPKTAPTYDTWSGVRISADEVKAFTRDHDFQLLALEGVQTQYMWTTWRKREPGWLKPDPSACARIRRITNAHSSEPVAPPIGRFSSFTLWLEDLPDNCDLNHLVCTIGAREAFLTYLGPRERDGLQQLNVMVPKGTPTGLQPIQLEWLGRPLCAPRTVRIIPPGPQVPTILSFTDGINMLAGQDIISGTVKVTIEEVHNLSHVRASFDETPAPQVEVFCADPLPPRYEINIVVPNEVPAGPVNLYVTIGERKLGPMGLTIRR